MRIAGAVLTVIVIAGCKPAPSTTATAGKAQTPPPRGAVVPSPGGVAAMPDFPVATPGLMHLTSAGANDLTSAAPAKAGLCEQPGVLLVESSQGGLGALLVLALPGAAARVGRYPVSYSMSGPAKLPDPPAAQFAVQRQTDRMVLAFQALEGNVEVYGFGARVSGRFQVTLREITSERIERVAGTFSDIPVERQSKEYCQRLAQPVDARQGRGAH